MPKQSQPTVGVRSEIPKPLHRAIKMWLADEAGDGYTVERIVQEGVELFARKHDIPLTSSGMPSPDHHPTLKRSE